MVIETSNMANDEGLFLRKASGLRRSASATDVFIFNTGLISVGLALAFNSYYLPAFYPEASASTASLIATGLMLLGGTGFYLWSALLPRSGGNYVFVSRAIHPALGFVVSWVEVCVLLFYTGVAAALIVRIGLTALLAGIIRPEDASQLAKVSEALSEPLPTFVGGAAVIAISSLLLSLGMRSFLRVQRLMFALAVIGTVALAWVLATIEPGAVGPELHRLFPDFDQKTVADAVSSKGWTLSSTTLAGSFAAIGWPLLPLAGGILSIGIGAEVQRAQRSQLIGILGSILASGLVFAVIGFMAERHVGRDLLGAISFANSEDLHLGVPTSIPWLPFLISVVSGNRGVAILVGLGFVAWIYLWIPGMLAYCNRSFLAWSLDRVGPAWLAEVHSTRQTPINASMVGGFVSTLLLAAYIWIPELQKLVIFQMLMFAWAISLAAGALFPYLRPQMFSAASGGGAAVLSKNWYSAVMSVAAAALLVAGIVLWNDPIAAGHSPLAVGLLCTIVLVGLALYVAASWYRQRSGIDISKAFSEIPVE
jgi:amino acid transporter